jgi:hypothetical protein
MELTRTPVAKCEHQHLYTTASYIGTDEAMAVSALTADGEDAYLVAEHFNEAIGSQARTSFCLNETVRASGPEHGGELLALLQSRAKSGIAGNDEATVAAEARTGSGRGSSSTTACCTKCSSATGCGATGSTGESGHAKAPRHLRS